MIPKQSLLDLIAIQMSCSDLSNLKRLSGEQQRYLAQKLEPLTPREEDLDQWNDALCYLTGAALEASTGMAKMRLIQCLKKPTEQRK